MMPVDAGCREGDKRRRRMLQARDRFSQQSCRFFTAVEYLLLVAFGPAPAGDVRSAQADYDINPIEGCYVDLSCVGVPEEFAVALWLTSYELLDCMVVSRKVVAQIAPNEARS